MKAIIYTRWSPRPDADTTEATQAQLTICRNHCRAKGYAVAGEFSDEDVSGDDDTRVGLWQAVDALKRGYVLVVADPERLARSVYLEERIHRDAEKRGASIEAVLGGHQGKGYDGDMIRQIMAAIRQREKKYNADRTKARMLAHQANGRAMSKHPPFGWKRVAKTLVLNDDEQATLARIREWHAAGMTPGWIVRRLNAEGQACRGKRWHRETIRRAVARS
jgi:site-specific DNA recombinase